MFTYGEYDPKVLDRLHRVEIGMLNDFMRFCDAHDIDYFAIAGTAIGAVRHKGFIPWDDDIDIAMLRDDYERFVRLMDEDPAFSAKYELWGHERENKYYNLIPELMIRGTLSVCDVAHAGGYRPGIMMDLFVYDNVPDDAKKAKRIIDKCRILKILYLTYNIDYGVFAKQEGGFTGFKDRILSVMHKLMRLIPNLDNFLYKRFMKYALSTRGASDTYTCLYDTGSHIMGIKKSKAFPTVRVPFEDTEIKLVKNYRAQLSRHMGRDFMQLPPEEKRTNHYPVEFDFGGYGGEASS